MATVLYLRFQLSLPAALEPTLDHRTCYSGTSGSNHQFYRISSERLSEREPSFILLFNKSRSEKLGDLPKDAQPNRDKIQDVIWVSWLLILSDNSDIPKTNQNQNYYSSSIYLGPAIILETTLPTFIYSFDKHLLYIFYVPGTIREENMVMNKPGSYFQGAYILVWRDNRRALSSQNLALREKIALRMFSGDK